MKAHKKSRFVVDTCGCRNIQEMNGAETCGSWIFLCDDFGRVHNVALVNALECFRASCIRASCAQAAVNIAAEQKLFSVKSKSTAVTAGLLTLRHEIRRGELQDFRNRLLSVPVTWKYIYSHANAAGTHRRVSFCTSLSWGTPSCTFAWRLPTATIFA